MVGTDRLRQPSWGNVRAMSRLCISLAALTCLLGSANADTPAPKVRAKAAKAAKAKPEAAFPAVVGTTFTFTSVEFKDTWTTKLAATDNLVQYTPHKDTLNYFSKAGMRVDAAGIHIVGETLADLGDAPPPPALAIAFPIKQGATAKVPGMIPTTYTIGARETIKVPAGSYSAWKITITDPANPAGAVWIAPEVGIVQIKLPSGRIDKLAKIAPPSK